MTELAEKYGVTTETIRRDLSMLERAGLVRRVHGGAVPAAALSVLEARSPTATRPAPTRRTASPSAALDLLPGHGGSVLLDAGTTTARLAGAAPPRPAARR